jgi:hypothetical protein
MTIGDKSDPYKEFFVMPRHLFDSLENEFFQLSFKYEYHLDIGGPEYAYAVWYLEEHMSALWLCRETGKVSTLGDYLKQKQMVEVISNRSGGWVEIGEKIHQKGIQHIDLYKKLE